MTTLLLVAAVLAIIVLAGLVVGVLIGAGPFSARPGRRGRP